MGYTIKELSVIIDRKPAMIYNYFKEDKSFYFSHRQTRNKGGFIYDDEVLERLKIRVGVESGVGADIKESREEEIPIITASPIDEEIGKQNKEIEELTNINKSLREEVERLKNENQELIKQNGALLLLLSQEKSEKQALLPLPRKSIGERIKSIFKK